MNLPCITEDALALVMILCVVGGYVIARILHN